MRKCISGVVLLGIILAGILINNYYLSIILDELETKVRQAQALAERGEFENAAREIDEIIDCWETKEEYFQSFMRHSETDEALLSLQEVQHHLEIGIPANFPAVYDKLAEILSMEQIDIKSIL